MKEKIIPVLLGADLNCYNVARAFHEEYGAASYAFGKYPLGATNHSRIVHFTAVPDLGDADTAISTLRDFAASHDGKRILLGCTDEYAMFITEHMSELDDLYIMPYSSAELVRDITQKDIFYDYCKRYGIPYPETVVWRKGDDASRLDSLPFDYPVIIKPSSSAEYWHHPFEGMKKVYVAHRPDEARGILGRIYSSGYEMNCVIQDFIPGDDSHMYVLTSYSDKNGKVRMMCLGHVLLEEHTPKGLGNHCAIVTEHKKELTERFKTFLEDIGYVGFSNFDIKYDARTDTYRAFEINTRQGRSNYYVTAAGYNIARLIVEDRITGNITDGCAVNGSEIFWSYIPDCVVKKYVPADLAYHAMNLKKCGRKYSSLEYPPDLRFNPRRCLFALLHKYHHIKKFKTYYKVEKQ